MGEGWGERWAWKRVVKMLRDLAFPSLMPGDGKVNKVFYFCINKAFSGPSFQPTLIYYLSFPTKVSLRKRLKITAPS